MSKDNGRIEIDPPNLPTDPTLEAAVCGLMLARPETAREAADIIGTAQAFSQPAMARIYEAVVESMDDGGRPDMHVIHARLIDDPPVLEALDACIHRYGLGIGPPTLYCAKQLAEMYARRVMIDRMWQATQSASSGSADPATIAHELKAELDRIAKSGNETALSQIGDLMNDLMEKRFREDSESGVSTGYPDIERFTGPMLPGQIMVVAGRTGMGKSALAQCILRNASRAGVPGVLLTTEMSRDQIAARIIASESKMSFGRIMYQNLDGNDGAEMSRVIHSVGQEPMHVIEIGGWTVGRCAAECSRMVRQHGVRLIVVDYLQQVESGSKYNNRQEEVAYISRSFKRLAMELETPIIAMSQLNRASEGRSDKRPQLSEMRESGAIEQDADMVLIVHREDYYRDEAEAPDNIAEVDIAKNRNGPTGMVKLFWHGPTMTFKSLQPTI